MSSHGRFKRNLFEIENARNLTRDEVVATFVPTQSFWRLLSSKNHIILGARGSGKTALAKMLAHDHLSRLRDRRAREAIRAKAFIGIYVPTSIEWVGGLKNKPWQTEEEAEQFFQWRLNISSCLAFLVTLRSCLDTYIEDRGRRARLEASLLLEISHIWSEGDFRYDTIRGLQGYLEDIEHRKQQQLARLRVTKRLRDGEDPAGIPFETSLFSPLKRGISIASRFFNFPNDATWILCLDEAEFLQPLHHRIINSYMRSYSGNLVFKMATMPYFHHTLETNTGVPLNVGHDFEYVYIDEDPVLWAGGRGREGEMFANTLFNKRASKSGSRFRAMQLKKLLGSSELLDPKEGQWTADSTELGLLRKYSSRDTLARAERLLSTPEAFMDQVGRKIHPALLLRDAVLSQTGRSEIGLYSGYSMAIRCADANPRRLIRIFNTFLLQTSSKEKRMLGQLSPKAQTRILTSFSTTSLFRVQSEPECGPELFEFLEVVGKYMHSTFYQKPLTTDQYYSIDVSRDVKPQVWRLVKRAVALGLLFPNVGANNPDQMPEREGTFHLGYVLAPHFRLLPRRGRAKKLSLILRDQPLGHKETEPIQEQFEFFEEV